MSKTTENLFLFEYEQSDGTAPFSIDTALNANFDKIDAFAGSTVTSLSNKANYQFADNPDFRAGHIVNQRTVSAFTVGAYGTDRWKLISGTATITANGITLNGTLRQIRETSIGLDTVVSVQMYSGTATATYNDSTRYLDIVSAGGTIARVHHGLIAITDWSKIPPADYGEELRKCQRYYEVIPTFRFYSLGRNPWSIATQTCLVPFMCTKRTIPVVSFLYEKSNNLDVFVSATASHPGINGFVDYTIAFDCDFVGFTNVVASADL